jgi:hypothetical protein
LSGCEAWYLTIREEHRFEGIQEQVPRRTFGMKGDEILGGWRKLHNKELVACDVNECSVIFCEYVRAYIHIRTQMDCTLAKRELSFW